MFHGDRHQTQKCTNCFGSRYDRHRNGAQPSGADASGSGVSEYIHVVLRPVFRAPSVANTSLIFAVDPSINAMQFVVQSACDA